MPRSRKKRKKSNKETLNSATIELKSGFTVRITPLPPYYKDLIDDTIPLPDYPTRTITLAAGDEIDWPYEPKEEHFELYVRWKAVDIEREELAKLRNRARSDFLLSNCVSVVDGPYDVDDIEWAQKVEAAFEDWRVPTHPGRRYLIFLRTQVLTDTEDLELVIRLSTAAEVTYQGVLHALRTFPVDMGQGGLGEYSGQLAEEQSVS
jgi:hypothetical protein